MDFYDVLAERKWTTLLHKVTYCPIDFYNQKKIDAFLDGMTSDKNASVLIYGDYDVDGAMFAKIAESAVRKLGMENIYVFRYRKRTHDLDREAVRFCIQNKFSYFIVGDTASSDIEVLQMLVAYGIKVMVLDHHITKYGYDDFDKICVPIINTTIENEIFAKDDFKFSAGALSFCVFDNYFRHKGLKPLLEESAYALISLYADCMDMSNIYNRSIYYLATDLDKQDLPSYVLHFMNEYQSLNARFIGYWYAPRINALFRSESFDILNRYLFDNVGTNERIVLIDAINHIYEGSRKMVGVLSDLVDVDVLDHFVICNLFSAVQKYNGTFHNLQNYTGLVANKLASRYGKTAVVYCSYENNYKGSVRDPYSRSYLQMFQQLCYAGGHGAAFGFVVKPFELSSFLKRLITVDKYFHIDDVDNEPIIIDHNYSIPDEGMINDIALYNEFSGNFLPIVFIRKQLIGNMKHTPLSYYHRYDWGEYFYVQSEFPIEFGQFMLIKPTWGPQIKLRAQI